MLNWKESKWWGWGHEDGIPDRAWEELCAREPDPRTWERELRALGARHPAVRALRDLIELRARSLEVLATARTASEREARHASGGAEALRNLQRELGRVLGSEQSAVSSQK